MDRYFRGAMGKLEKYLIEYDSYNELDKLDKSWEIDKCFEQILSQRFVKDYDVDLVKKIHDMILKLNSVSALVRLDSIMLSMEYAFYYRKIISEDIDKNVIELTKKRLLPFITDGLDYQLTVKDGYLARPFEYNNEVLNRLGKNMVKDIIGEVEYLESCLKDNNINILNRLYQEFTTEQLAFIYAQLNYYEYVNNSRFEYGSSDVSVNFTNERIYESMRERDNSEKIKFMGTICELGYCDVFLGICAMLVELYKTMDEDLMYCSLRGILSSRKYGCIRSEMEKDIILYSKCSKEIKQLRDEDIKNGIKVDTIYSYSRKYSHRSMGSSYRR